MTEERHGEGNTNLAGLSDQLEWVVDEAARYTVTVYGRRRLPASGIIWSDDGLIVTANHVVERNEDVTVGLADGRSVPVSVRGRSLESDIALLQVDPKEVGDLLSAPRSGSKARPGTIALAIGRPSDAGVMASFGIVQAAGKGVAGTRGTGPHGFVWAGVAMLPGFSGGPLVDVKGHMIGVNSSLLGGSGGLTVAYDLLDTIVTALAQHGRVRRGYIGIAAQSVELPAEQAQGQRRGLMVVSVEPGGPAASAGVLLGDVLLSGEGRALTEIEDLQTFLAADRVGAPVVIRVLRAGQLTDIEVIVGDRP